ncbi:hypothetical protein UP10_00695 [Bradyrhizobium sp. LTSPM299]|nr:hypothetical protein UP10_00695 [Bradyrhizobium sp. LTSPM299]
MSGGNLARVLIDFASFGCTKNSADEQSFGALNHDVVTTSDCRYQHDELGRRTMLGALILLTTFFAGFFAGYGARAWRSYKRRMLVHTSGRSRLPSTTFGHARRAF